jgi:hypothetical protein
VDGAGREVEQFGATTPELEKLARWLLERKVESVVMDVEEGAEAYEKRYRDARLN